MEENNKNSVGKVILVIILLILFLVAGFFGGKYYATNKKIESKEKKEEKIEEKEQELDVNSRLVQYLYNMVTPKNLNPNCSTDWEYSAGGTNKKYPEYTYNNEESSLVDLHILGENLKNKNKEVEYDDSKIPNVNNKKASYYYYEKSYIENVYKQIFGKTAKLDTSKAIPLDQHHLEELYYDAKSDKYFGYSSEGGGTCGPGGLQLEIDSAVKNAKELKIYQNVISITYKENADGSITEDEKNKQVEKYKYVYTFELEDDGMYKFVSRVKEK